MAALRHSTYLAPGQRYVTSGSPGWRSDRQVTVLAIARDRQGQVRVAYRGPNGNQVVEPAAQFEAAIATGQLVPVVGSGFLARW